MDDPVRKPDGLDSPSARAYEAEQAESKSKNASSDSTRTATMVTQKGASGGGPATATAMVRTDDGSDSAPLFVSAEAESLRSRWERIQASFIDEPKRSVEEADHLVDEAVRRLSEGFATERQKLEHQWAGGDQASTEDLRLSLRRYRSFFERLLRA